MSSFEGHEIFKAPPKKILLLINNFESYKEFLPGCLESSKLSDSKEGIEKGRLVFSILNKNYIFESFNKTSNFEVNINQSKGPFEDFNALWRLEVVDRDHTIVKFKTQFKLPFVLKIFATQSMINKIGKKFIQAFAKRLEES